MPRRPRPAVVPGYLQTVHSRSGPVHLLRVPCEPCDTFHVHGAGTGTTAYYVPGQTTERAPHCSSRFEDGGHYSRIRVQPERYRREWCTVRHNRLSLHWKRYAATVSGS